MPRKPKFIAGPSRLSKILEELRKPPRLTLAGVKALKMTLAVRNDHFGARHFMKEELPRIRYANPTLDIQVNKVSKTKADVWSPQMTLEFRNGDTHKIDMGKKWSTSIFEELMNVAGGNAWERWKAEREAQGLPVIEGAHRARSMESRLREQATEQAIAQEAALRIALEEEAAASRPKTGAAAVLP
ncbi:hypothetical protein JAAARDRAFT_181844 [Jaapia argillacea MUCL 33604]|uniref:Ribosomal protein/NADH dehydrogenase domain-containing protein n=1 Tax=Jaapia argillacea MUCL 33604 TaxID=933084 RepID=A0A067PJP3_9AGAM|nr:hypothetical protein JAAARDRAFT_181844 [Jaapia argillacea MUCL 33604]